MAGLAERAPRSGSITMSIITNQAPTISLLARRSAAPCGTRCLSFSVPPRASQLRLWACRGLLLLLLLAAAALSGRSGDAVSSPTAAAAHFKVIFMSS